MLPRRRVFIAAPNFCTASTGQSKPPARLRINCSGVALSSKPSGVLKPVAAPNSLRVVYEDFHARLAGDNLVERFLQGIAVLHVHLAGPDPIGPELGGPLCGFAIEAVGAAQGDHSGSIS